MDTKKCLDDFLQFCYCILVAETSLKWSKTLKHGMRNKLRAGRSGGYSRRGVQALNELGPNLSELSCEKIFGELG